MNGIPFLRDFYDKSIIPIGEKDKLTLKGQWNEDIDECTHWLIGLLWHGDEENGWKVAVYPISNEKPIWHYSSFFVSDSTYLFDEALNISRVIEKKSRKDLLTCGIIYEEISDDFQV